MPADPGGGPGADRTPDAARTAGGPVPAGDPTRGEDEVHGGVDVTVDDGAMLVRFWGSVDLAVRAAGSGGLGDLRGAGPLDLDLRDVTFMDSTGLSVLVRVVRDAAADGRPVRLLGAGGAVGDLLATTGVDAWMAALGVQGVTPV